MSIIVRGMQMPKDCERCDDSGLRSAIECPYYATPDMRNAYCPLVEIPEGHGRLIDESKLERNTVIAYERYCGEMMNHHREIAVFDDEIKNAPTILEEE